MTVDLAASTRSWLDSVADRTRAEVAAACGEHEPVHALVTRVLTSTTAELSISRLLAMAVAGALTDDPDAALPVCVVSRLWWTGAQLLDDVADGAERGMPVGAAVLAGTLCVAGLPLAVIERQELPGDLTRDWRRELLATSLHAAAGQLTDVALTDVSTVESIAWAPVIASYRGKSGAPYGRDAVMAARLASDEPSVLRGWRAFGELFGVLRQLANDAAPDSVDEDFRNGTRTALLAHALSASDEAGQTQLLRLRESARSDPAAHAALRRALWDPAVLAGYTAQIRLLRQHACALLDQLASPSPHRELLHALVHATAKQATPDAP